MRLSDLGEFELLHNHVLPMFSSVFPPADDAAVIGIPGDWDIVVTTDPCPDPVSCEVLSLSPSDRMWQIGWLTVVVNLSDLAAMGADPLGLVVSTEMPTDTDLDVAKSYFEGLRAASDSFDCPLVGGNVRERDFVLSTGTALGKVRRGRALTQGGACEGDLIAAVGRPGLFWASVLASGFGRDNLGAKSPGWDVAPTDWTADEVRLLSAALTRPEALVTVAAQLGSEGLVTAAVDASDGVGDALRKIANRSGLGVLLRPELPSDAHPIVERVAKQEGIDVRNLMMAWGGWELIVAFSPEKLESVQGVIDAANKQMTIFGAMSHGVDGVRFQTSPELEVNLCESERFTKSSYMTAGLDSYVAQLRRPFLSGT
ncbi:MAG: thiamine-phosphate kinase [Actinomycetota bacterium]